MSWSNQLPPAAPGGGARPRPGPRAVRPVPLGRGHQARCGGHVPRRYRGPARGPARACHGGPHLGSPQIRNRGTVGGNLGSASPAGDAHPPLLASGADVEVESVRGRRRIPIGDFFLGPKRSALEPDELIAAVRIPAATGPQLFAKVGTRNAMVIAVCSFALALRPDRRRVDTGLGSAGPVPLRASAAETFLEGVLEEGIAGRAVGRWAAAPCPASRTSPGRRPSRSTTSAGPPPTACTPCGCSAGECSAGPGKSAPAIRKSSTRCTSPHSARAGHALAAGSAVARLTPWHIAWLTRCTPLG